MPGEVRHLERVARHGQRCREVELLARPILARLERRELGRGHPAAKAERRGRVLVLDDVGHPVVAAGQVVQRLVRADLEAGLVCAGTGDSPHVAGLAAEVARGAVGVVALGAVEGGLDGSGLEVGRQRAVARDGGLRERAGGVFAERPLDDAVLVRQVVERRLHVHGGSERAARDHRVTGRLRAVRRREIANGRVGHVVARPAEVDVAVEGGLAELVACVGVGVWPELRGAAGERQHSRPVVARRLGGAVVGDVGLVHHAREALLVGIGHLVAGVAVDAVGVAGSEGTAVGGRRPSRVPATG